MAKKKKNAAGSSDGNKINAADNVLPNAPSSPPHPSTSSTGNLPNATTKMTKKQTKATSTSTASTSTSCSPPAHSKRLRKGLDIALYSSFYLIVLSLGIAIGLFRKLVMNANRILVTAIASVLEKSVNFLLTPCFTNLLIVVTFTALLSRWRKIRGAVLIICVFYIAVYIGNSAFEYMDTNLNFAAAGGNAAGGHNHQVSPPSPMDTCKADGFHNLPDHLLAGMKFSFHVLPCNADILPGDWVGVFLETSCRQSTGNNGTTSNSVVMCQENELISSTFEFSSAAETAILRLTNSLPSPAEIPGNHPDLNAVVRYCRSGKIKSHLNQLRKESLWKEGKRWWSLIDSNLGNELWATVTGRQPYECVAASQPIPLTITPQNGNLVGIKARLQGLKPKHPVIMIPGVITTALELWEAPRDCQDLVGKRVWINPEIMIFRTECWLATMELNVSTGGDPVSTRVRPLQGYAAADYLLPGEKESWVWGRQIEALKAVGYDQSSMVFIPYDWRLSPSKLQSRDRWMSFAKSTIEYATRTNEERAVIVGHSMGSAVINYLMEWIEHPLGGNDPGWVARHVHSIVHVGGAMLGAPKAARFLLSGETSEVSVDVAYTKYAGTIIQDLINNLFPPSRLMEAASSFGSLQLLFPRGGDAVWTKPIFEVKDDNATFPVYLSNITTLFNASLPGHARTLHTFQTEHLLGARASNESKNTSRSWSNVLTTPLRTAANTTIYCLYSIDEGSEMLYNYRKTAPGNPLPFESDRSHPNGIVVSGDGDGTVPLVSLALPCMLWKKSLLGLNPNNSTVRIKEFRLKPGCAMTDFTQVLSARRSPCAVDHVNLIGNDEILEHVTMVATGAIDQQQWNDDISSEFGNDAVVMEYADRIMQSPED